MTIRLFRALVLIAVITLASQAHAALVTITGSGTFGNTPLPYSVYQPGQAFSFSFQLENPLMVDPHPDIDLYNTAYVVGGTSPAAIIAVEFFDSASGGLFSLGFDNGDSLSFIGPDIGSTGVLASGPQSGALFGSAIDYGTAVINVAAVPLPGSLALFGFGLVVVVAFRAARRERLSPSRSD